MSEEEKLCQSMGPISAKKYRSVLFLLEVNLELIVKIVIRAEVGAAPGPVVVK
jgi:hypothetical protein